MNGIGVTQLDRGFSSDGRQYLVQNLDVHDNVIIQASGTATGIVSAGYPEIYTGWHNWFYHNTYHLQDLSGRYFQWMDWDRTPNEWQGYGNDGDGTFGPIS